MKQKLDKSRCQAYNKHIRLYSDLKYYEKDVSQMKNTIKKIAATAMAFAILGSGTTAINTISSKSENTIIATAAHKHTWVYDHTEYGCHIYYQCKSCKKFKCEINHVNRTVRSSKKVGNYIKCYEHGECIYCGAKTASHLVAVYHV